jgi:hypothetical protein
MRRAARCGVVAAAGVGLAFTASPVLAAPTPALTSTTTECYTGEDGDTGCVKTHMVERNPRDGTIVLMIRSNLTVTAPDGTIIGTGKDRIMTVATGVQVRYDGRSTVSVGDLYCNILVRVHYVNMEAQREIVIEDCNF